MFRSIKRSTGFTPALGLALLCLAVSILSSVVPAEAHSLNASAESLIMGGSDCSDFMDGVAVAMGIGVLFGCVWCGAGAIVAKGVALFC